MATEDETMTVTGDFTFEYDVDKLDPEADPKEQAKRLAKDTLLGNPELVREGLSASLNEE